MDLIAPFLIVGALQLAFFWAGLRLPGRMRAWALVFGVALVIGAGWFLRLARIDAAWDALGWFIVGAGLLFPAVGLLGGLAMRATVDRIGPHTFAGRIGWLWGSAVFVALYVLTFLLPYFGLF